MARGLSQLRLGVSCPRLLLPLVLAALVGLSEGGIYDRAAFITPSVTSSLPARSCRPRSSACSLLHLCSGLRSRFKQWLFGESAQDVKSRWIKDTINRAVDEPLGPPPDIPDHLKLKPLSPPRSESRSTSASASSSSSTTTLPIPPRPSAAQAPPPPLSSLPPPPSSTPQPSPPPSSPAPRPKPAKSTSSWLPRSRAPSPAPPSRSPSAASPVPPPKRVVLDDAPRDRVFDQSSGAGSSSSVRSGGSSRMNPILRDYVQSKTRKRKDSEPEETGGGACVESAGEPRGAAAAAAADSGAVLEKETRGAGDAGAGSRKGAEEGGLIDRLSKGYDDILAGIGASAAGAGSEGLKEEEGVKGKGKGDEGVNEVIKVDESQKDKEEDEKEKEKEKEKEDEPEERMLTAKEALAAGPKKTSFLPSKRLTQKMVDFKASGAAASPVKGKQLGLSLEEQYGDATAPRGGGATGRMGMTLGEVMAKAAESAGMGEDKEREAVQEPTPPIQPKKALPLTGGPGSWKIVNTAGVPFYAAPLNVGVDDGLVEDIEEGTFKVGEVVTVSEVEDNWAKVTKPQEGWVRLKSRGLTNLIKLGKTLRG